MEENIDKNLYDIETKVIFKDETSWTKLVKANINV